MKSPLSATNKGVRTMEASLQKFGKRIRKNINQGQRDLATGKIGRNDFINPLKKPAMGNEDILRASKNKGADESVARTRAVANRTKKKK